MPPDNSQPIFVLNLGQDITSVFQVGIVLLALLYFLFSLIVVRQVNLMTDTLITPVSPFLRFLSVLHAGFALGIVVIFLAIFLSSV